MRYEFIWDEDNGTAVCNIYYKNKKFLGRAVCHEHDFDMMSEKTGSFIAESRAYKKCLAYIRDNEIKPALTALKHAYDIMKSNKDFNEDSAEAKVMRRQIKVKENDLITIRHAIYFEQDYLREYIRNKEKLYQTIRKGQSETKT